MKVYWKIVITAIIFVVSRMTITIAIIHLHHSLPSSRLMSLYADSLFWIAVLVHPVLFVIVSYFLGKKLDLKKNLLAVMVSLFAGCFTGHLIENSIAYLYSAIYMISSGTDNYIALLYSTVIFTVISFLIGFSSLAIGYLRKLKTMNMPLSSHGFCKF